MSAAPHCLLETRDELTQIKYGDDSQTESTADPFNLLKEFLPFDHASSHAHLPFIGGALGYFGYDLGRRLEKIPAESKQDINLPDMCIGIYPWAIIQDHATQEAWLILNSNLSRFGNSDYDFSIIENLINNFDPLNNSIEKNLHSNAFRLNRFKKNISAERYNSSVSKIKEYIYAGDCYQVNFAQRFSAQFTGDPLIAYLALRKKLPSPFSAYMQLDNASIVSLSPERFIHIKNCHVETKPIKGTIKRGSTLEEDEKNARWLQQSKKNRAENVMIVDLLRNDLSKHCVEVKVPLLCELQSFANVHHLVSTITGELSPDASAIDVLRDSFPGGSITGAPKIRAMEIIEELEPTRRSVYCGSMGYISADGQMDTNIAIRTVICDGNNLHCWGGGGIVADSDIGQEYMESIAKVQVLLETMENNFAN